MEILLVEDERRVRKFLEDALKAEGHSIFSCESIEDVQTWMTIQGNKPDIFILDRMLKDSDGITLIKPVKSKFPTCKIIVLSAIGLADEKAQALDLGADDYISKPFSLAELSARIRALSRRVTKNVLTSNLILKNLTIDLTNQSVHTDIAKIDLSKKEFQLLCTLANHPSRVFNKYQLLDKVWDQQADIESNIVEVTIKNLRKKLIAANCQAEICSKRNLGYWIEA